MKNVVLFICSCLISCAEGSEAASDPPPSPFINGTDEQYPDDPRDFRADVTFTEIERVLIVDFLGRLSEKTGYHIGIVFDLPHVSSYDRGYAPKGERKVIFKTNEPGGQYSGSDARTIRVNADIQNPGQVAWVVSHEMGHDFGFDHVSDRGSLMSKYYYHEDVSWNWTDLDQRECVRVGVCK